MLLSRSQAWTRWQRWLIAGGVLAGLILFSALVYCYERYYRGPDERALFGTWQCIENCISKPYATFFEVDYCFKPDHSFEVLSHEDSGRIAEGSWYAAGRFVYLRLPYLWFEDAIPDGVTIREVFVWRIQDIGPNELRVQLWTDLPPRVYRRVGLCAPNASNQSLEPTAGRSVTSLFVTKTTPRRLRPPSPAAAQL
jgi:hypothetical protein